jgi:hypothetical protein
VDRNLHFEDDAVGLKAGLNVLSPSIFSALPLQLIFSRWHFHFNTQDNMVFLNYPWAPTVGAAKGTDGVYDLRTYTWKVVEIRKYFLFSFPIIIFSLPRMRYPMALTIDRAALPP